MKSIDKKWDRALKEMSQGNQKYIQYFLCKSDPKAFIGDKGIIPDALVMYWKNDESILMEGTLYGCSICAANCSYAAYDDITLTCIVNASNVVDIEILVAAGNLSSVYNGKSSTHLKNQKLLVFQENKYFADIIWYDSRTAMPASRITLGGDIGRMHLRNIALSLFSMHGLDIDSLKVASSDE